MALERGVKDGPDKQFFSVLKRPIVSLGEMGAHIWNNEAKLGFAGMGIFLTRMRIFFVVNARPSH